MRLVRHYQMRRVLLAVFFGAMIALAVAPAGARADVSVTCTPAPCEDVWHTTDVAIEWTVTPPNQTVTGCVDQTLSADSATTAGTELSCSVEGGATLTIHVKIDRTPPILSHPLPNAAGWFRTPVTITGSDALSGPLGCNPAASYSGPDRANMTLSGSCTDAAGNSSSSSFTFGFDATAPAVVGTPTRPPDFNGWYNHPVVFAFSGGDATSGIASCDSATYSGPTDGTASVTGGCTDNAGNRGTATASLRYDSTRPTPANLTIKPRSHALRLTWPSIPDANNFVITRLEQGSSAAPATVYSGSGHSVLDKGLQNGRKYRYTITNTDQAGNSSSQTVPAVPTGNSLRPVVGARVTSAPLLTWKKVKGARYYNIQLYREGRKVLSTWPKTNAYQVKSKWRFRKKRYVLTPGHYRWYVWPGIGKRSQNRYGHILGRSSFRFAAP